MLLPEFSSFISLVFVGSQHLIEFHERFRSEVLTQNFGALYECLRLFTIVYNCKL